MGPRSSPIETQQLAIPKLITVAIQQEAEEDPNCPDHHNSLLHDNERRGHSDKALTWTGSHRQAQWYKAVSLPQRRPCEGTRAPVYSSSSGCAIISSSASTYCLHKGRGRLPNFPPKGIHSGRREEQKSNGELRSSFIQHKREWDKG